MDTWTSKCLWSTLLIIMVTDKIIQLSTGKNTFKTDFHNNKEHVQCGRLKTHKIQCVPTVLLFWDCETIIFICCILIFVHISNYYYLKHRKSTITALQLRPQTIIFFSYNHKIMPYPNTVQYYLYSSSFFFRLYIYTIDIR